MIMVRVRQDEPKGSYTATWTLPDSRELTMDFLRLNLLKKTLCRLITADGFGAWSVCFDFSGRDRIVAVRASRVLEP